MRDVIQSQMRGENRYPLAFRAAQRFWSEFFAENRGADDSELKKAIEGAELAFRFRIRDVAGQTPSFAQSIMAMAAIGALYYDGFEDETFARRVGCAFTESRRLSSKVRDHAKKAVKLYDLA